MIKEYSPFTPGIPVPLEFLLHFSLLKNPEKLHQERNINRKKIPLVFSSRGAALNAYEQYVAPLELYNRVWCFSY